ncbi:hypothetical protein C7I85_29050 [Mesorhizobium soli]|uniref:Uncharacterized protein n=1 Tax=Pseudaminobacter soli (ex Li et al. 2025) TaxID=1295366 RepID=A0A2P7RPS5_9HYPH|nr:hypothetical protein C7I85_29050 [Mesorhizobium soli]
MIIGPARKLSALTDTPAGLAAWLLDHDDGYAQPASAMQSAVLGRTVNGHSAGHCPVPAQGH